MTFTDVRALLFACAGYWLAAVGPVPNAVTAAHAQAPAATADRPSDATAGGDNAAAAAPGSAKAAQLPPRPESPRAARVYNAMETYCARCHQAGKLEKSQPAAGIGNIMALDEIGRDASLVIPGAPDASRLYDIMLSRHSPIDIYNGSGDGREPSPEDLEALRIWIRDMPAPKNRCADRQPIKSQAVENWMDEAQRVARDSASELRFISLVELYNTCASVEEISAARQAITKLMNSLSWAPAPRKLTALDPDQTILSFRLSDFGWVAAHWDTVLKTYPAALVSPVKEKIRKVAATANPIVRGDWLADAVNDPKLYYVLLGLPAKLTELAKMNGIDLAYNVRIARARRAVIRDSSVTRGNRLAERHPGTRGGFWLVYDFATSSGEQDLFEHPLGPKSAVNVKAPFKADLTRVQFTLPNGFLAYGLYDSAGNRIDSVLPGVVEPEYPGASDSLGAGVQCFACHSDGVKAMRDDYRARPASDMAAVSKDVLDAALQLSATDGEMVLLKDADNERYRSALIAAGVEPAATFRGDEVIAALARRYRSGAGYAGVAAELGLEQDAFAAALEKTSGAIAILAGRLRHEQLDRKTLEPLFAYLKGVELPPAEPRPASVPPAATGRIALKLWLDKPKTVAGDVIVVNVETDTDCYLTLLNVDPTGTATVIYPNDFESDNLIAAGKTIRLPGPEAPYQLRRKDEGRELLVGQCSTSPAPPTGVEHEFGRQRFTVLGNWENFVRDALITDADLRSSPEKAARARRAAAQSRRGQRDGAPERGDTAPGRTLVDGRAVAIID